MRPGILAPFHPQTPQSLVHGLCSRRSFAHGVGPGPQRPQRSRRASAPSPRPVPASRRTPLLRHRSMRCALVFCRSSRPYGRSRTCFRFPSAPPTARRTALFPKSHAPPAGHQPCQHTHRARRSWLAQRFEGKERTHENCCLWPFGIETVLHPKRFYLVDPHTVIWNEPDSLPLTRVSAT